MSTRYNNGSHYENHQRAAELHEIAAHAHLSAAETHEKQDHETGQERSRQALEHSQLAYQHSAQTAANPVNEHGFPMFGHNEIAALAMGQEADPSLGNPQFVSSKRTSPGLASLSWFSTIPYLSVVLANFSPSRLVIDPAGNYFWLSCATATQNRDAQRAVPTQARELIRVYSCLHR